MNTARKTGDYNDIATRALADLDRRGLIHEITRRAMDDAHQEAVLGAIEGEARGSRQLVRCASNKVLDWQRGELRNAGYTIARGACLPARGSATSREALPDDIPAGDRAADPPASLETREEALVVARRIARMPGPARAVATAVARGATLAAAARHAHVSRHAARAAIDQATGRRSPVATQGR